MSINAATWSNLGNLSGTLDGNTIQKVQGAIGNGTANNAVPASLFVLSASCTEAIATLQTSTWFDLHSMPGAVLEVIQTGYLGSLSIEVTNDGTNIYTIYNDNNPSTAQTLNTPLNIPSLFRFFRCKATPTVSNTGTLAFQARTYGQDSLQFDFGGIYPGVLYMGPQTILVSAARTTNSTYDFKVPIGAVGFDVWVNQTALTGTSATWQIQRKDPTSGNYSSVASYGTLSSAAITSTGTANLAVAPGITATSNVSISASPGTHWGLTTTGTFTTMTASATVQFTI